VFCVHIDKFKKLKYFIIRYITKPLILISTCTTHCTIWRMCDRASYMKMTRGTNLMQQMWFIIINISTCFGHLYVHLQDYRLCAAAAAYGV